MAKSLRRWWPERLFRPVLLTDLMPGTLFWVRHKPEPYPSLGPLAGPYTVEKHTRTRNGVLTTCTAFGQSWPTSGGTVFVPKHSK